MLLEAGKIYSFGIYDYSPEYIEQNKDHPSFKHIYYLPLESGAKKFGVICFEDN